MKLEDSLPLSQAPATCSYPEQARSSPYSHFLNLNIILPSKKQKIKIISIYMRSLLSFEIGYHNSDYANYCLLARLCFLSPIICNMEAADPSETLVPICQTTQRCITEDTRIYNAIIRKWKSGFFTFTLLKSEMVSYENMTLLKMCLFI
jgi:hypothetical protein